MDGDFVREMITTSGQIVSVSSLSAHKLRPVCPASPRGGLLTSHRRSYLGSGIWSVFTCRLCLERGTLASLLKAGLQNCPSVSHFVQLTATGQRFLAILGPKSKNSHNINRPPFLPLLFQSHDETPVKLLFPLVCTRIQWQRQLTSSLAAACAQSPSDILPWVSSGVFLSSYKARNARHGGN